MATVLAIFDFDGTLFQGRVWRSVVEYFRDRSLRRDFLRGFRLRQTLRWLLAQARLMDRDTFVYGWMRDLAGIFQGYTEQELRDIFSWIVNDDIAAGLRQQVLEKVREHRDQGHPTVLLSGSYELLLEVFNQRFGLDYAVGTRLAFEDGQATGRIATPVCMGEEKPRRIRALIKEKGLDADLAASYTYIDSVWDLPLARIVGHPVVVAPEDEKMREQAKANGWPVME